MTSTHLHELCSLQFLQEHINHILPPYPISALPSSHNSHLVKPYHSTPKYTLLPLIRIEVERNHADCTLQNVDGFTALEILLQQPLLTADQHQCIAYLLPRTFPEIDGEINTNKYTKKSSQTTALSSSTLSSPTPTTTPPAHLYTTTNPLLFICEYPHPVPARLALVNLFASLPLYQNDAKILTLALIALVTRNQSNTPHPTANDIQHGGFNNDSSTLNTMISANAVISNHHHNNSARLTALETIPSSHDGRLNQFLNTSNHNATDPINPQPPSQPSRDQPTQSPIAVFSSNSLLTQTKPSLLSSTTTTTAPTSSLTSNHTGLFGGISLSNVALPSSIIPPSTLSPPTNTTNNIINNAAASPLSQPNHESPHSPAFPSSPSSPHQANLSAAVPVDFDLDASPSPGAPEGITTNNTQLPINDTLETSSFSSMSMSMSMSSAVFSADYAFFSQSSFTSHNSSASSRHSVYFTKFDPIPELYLITKFLVNSITSIHLLRSSQQQTSQQTSPQPENPATTTPKPPNDLTALFPRTFFNALSLATQNLISNAVIAKSIRLNTLLLLIRTIVQLFPIQAAKVAANAQHAINIAIQTDPNFTILDKLTLQNSFNQYQHATSIKDLVKKDIHASLNGIRKIILSPEFQPLFNAILKGKKSGSGEKSRLRTGSNAAPPHAVNQPHSTHGNVGTTVHAPSSRTTTTTTETQFTSPHSIDSTTVNVNVDTTHNIITTTPLHTNNTQPTANDTSSNATKTDSQPWPKLSLQPLNHSTLLSISAQQSLATQTNLLSQLHNLISTPSVDFLLLLLTHPWFQKISPQWPVFVVKLYLSMPNPTLLSRDFYMYLLSSKFPDHLVPLLRSLPGFPKPTPTDSQGKYHCQLTTSQRFQVLHLLQHQLEYLSTAYTISQPVRFTNYPGLPALDELKPAQKKSKISILKYGAQTISLDSNPLPRGAQNRNIGANRGGVNALYRPNGGKKVQKIDNSSTDPTAQSDHQSSTQIKLYTPSLHEINQNNATFATKRQIQTMKNSFSTKALSNVPLAALSSISGLSDISLSTTPTHTRSKNLPVTQQQQQQNPPKPDESTTTTTVMLQSQRNTLDNQQSILFSFEAIQWLTTTKFTTQIMKSFFPLTASANLEVDPFFPTNPMASVGTEQEVPEFNQHEHDSNERKSLLTQHEQDPNAREDSISSLGLAVLHPAHPTSQTMSNNNLNDTIHNDNDTNDLHHHPIDAQTHHKQLLSTFTVNQHSHASSSRLPKSTLEWTPSNLFHFLFSFFLNTFLPLPFDFHTLSRMNAVDNVDDVKYLPHQNIPARQTHTIHPVALTTASPHNTTLISTLFSKSQSQSQSQFHYDNHAGSSSFENSINILPTDDLYTQLLKATLKFPIKSTPQFIPSSLMPFLIGHFTPLPPPETIPSLAQYQNYNSLQRFHPLNLTPAPGTPTNQTMKTAATLSTPSTSAQPTSFISPSSSPSSSSSPPPSSSPIMHHALLHFPLFNLITLGSSIPAQHQYSAISDIFSLLHIYHQPFSFHLNSRYHWLSFHHGESLYLSPYQTTFIAPIQSSLIREFVQTACTDADLNVPIHPALAYDNFTSPLVSALIYRFCESGYINVHIRTKSYSDIQRIRAFDRIRFHSIHNPKYYGFSDEDLGHRYYRLLFNPTQHSLHRLQRLFFVKGIDPDKPLKFNPQINIEHPDGQGLTLLSRLVVGCKRPIHHRNFILNTLINQNANPYVYGRKNRPLIHEIISNAAFSEILPNLLQKHPSLLSLANPAGILPLHITASLVPLDREIYKLALTHTPVHIVTQPICIGMGSVLHMLLGHGLESDSIGYLNGVHSPVGVGALKASLKWLRKRQLTHFKILDQLSLINSPLLQHLVTQQTAELRQVDDNGFPLVHYDNELHEVEPEFTEEHQVYLHQLNGMAAFNNHVGNMFETTIEHVVDRLWQQQQQDQERK